VSLQLHYTGSLKSMDLAKYFQNGLAELIEILHTVIYFEDARLTCFFF
jgi:hypothetical protein